MPLPRRLHINFQLDLPSNFREEDLGNCDLSLTFQLMGWSPQCYIPSFVQIGPPFLEKKIFEGFLLYMGVAAILDKDPVNKLAFPLPMEAAHKIST